MRTLVVLHEAWVPHGTVGRDARCGAHAAFGFLHDHGEDETVVDACAIGNGLDGFVE